MNYWPFGIILQSERFSQIEIVPIFLRLFGIRKYFDERVLLEQFVFGDQTRPEHHD